MAAEKKKTLTRNGLSLQQWYKVYEEVLSFSFVFFAFIAILKKIRYILVKLLTETAKMQ